MKSKAALRRSGHLYFRPLRNTSEAIHIKRVYDDGLFCIGENRYSVSYAFQDINYTSLSKEDREKVFLSYEELLNSLDPTLEIFITISKRRSSISSIRDRSISVKKDDGYDGIRKQYDDLFLMNIRDAEGSAVERYITFAAQKKSAAEARSFFSRMENDLSSYFLSLGSGIRKLDCSQRLQILGEVLCADGYGGKELLLENRKRGQGFSSLISPVYMKIGKDHIEADERYLRTMFLKDYPSYIRDSFISELLDTEGDMMLTIKIRPVAVDRALRETEKRLLGVENNITNWQRRRNHDRDILSGLPFDMEQQRSELKEFLNDLMNRDQKMFLSGITFLVVSDTAEGLSSITESVMQTGRKYLLRIGTLTYQQLEGLNEVLPAGHSCTDIWRTLTSEALSAFIPFRCMDMDHRNGIWYGRNRISRNMVRIDRNTLLNGNEFILGVSGSGKSFCAKNEIVQSFLKGDADIMIIDPEREYGKLTRTLGGEVIEISPSSRTHINPMDIEGTDISDSTLADKNDFILSLMSSLKGDELTAKEKSVIDRCVRDIYRDYLSGRKKEMPVLKDLYRRLLRQEEEEGKELALVLEMFSKGSVDCFSEKTNIDTENRLICYDIYELGKQMAGTGMLIVLDSIMNRIMRNREKGRKTLVYIDEIYLLFRKEHSADFLFSLWKRIRKYGAYAIGVTQNVEDLLESQRARAMISNSELLVMLNQAHADRQRLRELVRFSDSEERYLTDSSEGQGLLKVGKTLIPFELDIPEQSGIFRLLGDTKRDLPESSA
ncbi:MAG: ATP-binding protein [Clostridia bacterium]|nr:ATP-binding protein [Clostridia bacterium]